MRKKTVMSWRNSLKMEKGINERPVSRVDQVHRREYLQSELCPAQIKY